MAIDYFKFQRKRIFFYLDADACELHGVKPESAQHPHVIMEARPTFGATQFVRDQQKRLPQARAKARATLEVERIRDRVKAMTADEVKEDISAIADKSVRTKLDLEDHYVSALEHLSPEVHDAGYRIMMTRIAVCVRHLGGDYRCYSESWASTPEWPALDSDDALETRIKILERLSQADLGKLNTLAVKSLEVTEEDEKK
jgi:hypothetical protein